MVFWYLRAKLQQSWDYRVSAVAHSAGNKNTFWLSFKQKCARFFAFRNFTMLQKQPKRRLQADIALEINKHGRHNWHQWSQTLRTNYKQLRLNIGKEIKTASLNSKFTDSCKKACLRYYKSRIQLRYCYLWLIYCTVHVIKG